jgi:hypothetical protein
MPPPKTAGCAGGFVTTKNRVFPGFYSREKIHHTPPILRFPGILLTRKKIHPTFEKKHTPPEKKGPPVARTPISPILISEQATVAFSADRVEISTG